MLKAAAESNHADVPMNGLSTAEAAERLSRVGQNALPEAPPIPWGAMLDESILMGESIAVDMNDGDEAFSWTLLVGGKACSGGNEDRSIERHGSPPRSAPASSAGRRGRTRRIACGTRRDVYRPGPYSLRPIQAT